MCENEFVGSIEFSLSTLLKPWDGDPDDYWIESHGTIIVCPDHDDNPDAEMIAGKVEIVIFKVVDAINDRVSLFEVFDAYGELSDIYTALFTKDGTSVLSETDSLPSDVVFIHSLNIDSEYQNSRIMFQVVESIVSTFGNSGITVAFKDTLTLNGSEWSTMGFVETADSNIVVRNEAMGY